MRKSFSQWSTSDLSLLGRVLIAKTQGISQLLYLANSIQVPQWVIKETKKIIYKFIWKGPDKITRLLQARAMDKGGVNMPYIDDVIAAAGAQWIRRRASTRFYPWARMMDADFNKNGATST